MQIKIFGAGSAGNHLSQACRRMGWQVTVVDIDQSALERMKKEIYPQRYGFWDEEIKLSLVKDAPQGDFDVIFIATPPDSHLNLAIKALKEGPRLLQIEKPLCPLSLEGVEKFLEELKRHPQIPVIVGYEHPLGKNTLEAEKILKEGILGKTMTLDVEFRVTWDSIFAAHPWLAGPEDSYLGFWQRGGGASAEHSHATHLWQHFAQILGLGRVKEVSASLQMVKNDKVNYDQAYFANLITEEGFIGRVVQDVVTDPVRIWARIQGEKGFLEWWVGARKNEDLIRYQIKGKKVIENFISKKRPDDFYAEVLHIQDILEGKIKPEDSPLSLRRGLETILVIAGAYQSHREKRTIEIDYSLTKELK